MSEDFGAESSAKCGLCWCNPRAAQLSWSTRRSTGGFSSDAAALPVTEATEEVTVLGTQCDPDHCPLQKTVCFLTIQRVTGEIEVWESSEGSNSNTGVSLACGRVAPVLSEVVEAELSIYQCTPPSLPMGNGTIPHWGLGTDLGFPLCVCGS